MKKHILFVCLMALSVLGIAQTNLVHFSNPEEAPYYLAYGLLANQKHAEALDAAKKALKELPQGTPHADSLIAETHFIMGASYGYLQKTDKAVKEFDTAAQMFAKIYGDGQGQEAKMYTHSAHFLNAAKRYKEANEYVSKATDIYMKNPLYDRNMGDAMMLAAEINYQLKNLQECIRYQRFALQVYEHLYGKHHKQYLEECSYLYTYLQEAGQTDEAKQLLEEVAKLAEEAQSGYVPRDTKFTTPEQCHMYNEDATYAALYYLSRHISADHMAFVAQYLTNFGEVTDEVMIIGGVEEEKWMKECGNSLPWLNAAYTAANIYVQLQTKEELPSLQSYIIVNHLLCAFYEANSNVLDKSKTLDNYLALKNKDAEKFNKLLAVQYEETMKGLSNVLKIAKGEESSVIPEHPIVDAIFGQP